MSTPRFGRKRSTPRLIRTNVVRKASQLKCWVGLELSKRLASFVYLLPPKQRSLPEWTTSFPAAPNLVTARSQESPINLKSISEKYFVPSFLTLPIGASIISTGGRHAGSRNASAGKFLTTAAPLHPGRV